MSRLLRCCLVAIPVSGLAACAGHGQMRYEPAASTIIQPKSFAQDDAYMQAVERQARRRGLSVQWIHPPLKRVMASAGGSDLE